MQPYLLAFALILTFLFLYPGFLLRKLSRQRTRVEVRERANRQKDYYNRGNVPDDRC